MRAGFRQQYEYAGKTGTVATANTAEIERRNGIGPQALAQRTQCGMCGFERQFASDGERAVTLALQLEPRRRHDALPSFSIVFSASSPRVSRLLISFSIPTLRISASTWLR